MKIWSRSQRIDFFIAMAPKKKNALAVDSFGAGLSAPARASDRADASGRGGKNCPHYSGASSQTSGVVCSRNNHPRGDEKAKSRKILSNFLFIGLFSSKDFAPCMENLHAKEPFRY